MRAALLLLAVAGVLVIRPPRPSAPPSPSIAPTRPLEPLRPHQPNPAQRVMPGLF